MLSVGVACLAVAAVATDATANRFSCSRQRCSGRCIGYSNASLVLVCGSSSRSHLQPHHHRKLQLVLLNFRLSTLCDIRIPRLSCVNICMMPNRESRTHVAHSSGGSLNSTMIPAGCIRFWDQGVIFCQLSTDSTPMETMCIFRAILAQAFEVCSILRSLVCKVTLFNVLIKSLTTP